MLCSHPFAALFWLLPDHWPQWPRAALPGLVPTFFACVILSQFQLSYHQWERHGVHFSAAWSLWKTGNVCDGSQEIFWWEREYRGSSSPMRSALHFRNREEKYLPDFSILAPVTVHCQQIIFSHSVYSIQCSKPGLFLHNKYLISFPLC